MHMRTPASTSFQVRLLRSLFACGLLLGLAACGDGQSSAAVNASPPSLTVDLSLAGTQLTCQGYSGTSYRLRRTSGTSSTEQSINCPGALWLAGDTVLSQWTLDAYGPGARTPYATVSAHTRLPAPVVVADGPDWVVLPASIEDLGSVEHPELVLSHANGVVISRFSAPDRIARSVVSSDPGADGRWSWQATDKGVVYQSREVPTFSLDRTYLGYWGALATGDTNNDGIVDFLGSLGGDTGQTPAGYEPLGLNGLFEQRVFRDVRIVDLNNDGLSDIVANVYGAGCTLIGFGRIEGGYDFETPRRRDGSCIDGHGETILVADFDGDGWIDIALPSYERMDYLKNLGNGLFVEVADSIGLSMPAYRPTFEGAAAVDLDLNGTVDIVLAGEVLLNDGHAHFTHASLPFQGAVMQDEGLSVADLDGDGLYDVVKLHPVFGPRFFWGNSDRVHFIDSGSFVNVSGQTDSGAPFNDEADGIATGFLTGNSLPDVVIAGGQVAGTPPRLCSANRNRQVSCLTQTLPAFANSSQDLLLITDLDGDGQTELIARGNQMALDRAPLRMRQVFSMDLRDADGRQTLQGLSARAVCVASGELLQLQFIDGGNGYMAQGNYAISYSSPTCHSIWLDVATTQGLKRLGPFGTGQHRVALTPGLLAGAGQPTARAKRRQLT